MVPMLVLLVFVGFIVADIVLQSSEARRLKARPRLALAAASRGGVGAIDVPPGLFLDRGHTWLSLEPAGTARIGIDDFARRILGRLEAVELPEPGTFVRRGDPLFFVRQGHRKAAFAAPVDGVVSSVNVDVREGTEALERDPYGRGWICALKPANLASRLRSLFVGEESRAWIRQESDRFVSVFLPHLAGCAALGAVLPDGGQIADGALQSADDEAWNLFVGEFLQGRSGA